MKRNILFLSSCVMLLLWHLHVSGQAQEALIPSNISAVRLDWHPSRDLIAISDAGSIVTIVYPQTREVINTLPVMPFPVRALKWSDDGTRLAVGGEYAIQIWEQAWDETQMVLSLSLQVPPDPLGLNMLHVLDWNDVAEQILADLLGRIYIWHSRTGELIETIDPFTTPMVSAAWNPDGTRLAHADITGFVSIELLTANNSGGADAYNRDAPWAMAWEPNGNNLIVGTSGGTLQAFDYFPRRLGSDVVSTREEYVAIFSVDWHPTLRLVAVGYADGIVEIWNPYTYDLIQRVQQQTGLPVMSVSWSPDGTQLAYTAGDNLMIIPAPQSDIPALTLTPSSTPTSISTSPPTRTPIPTATPIPLPPADTNLLTNPSFASGLVPWNTVNFSAGGVVNGALEVTQPTGVEYGVVWQSLSTMLPANTPMSFSVALGNASAVPKRVQVILRTSNWAQAATCEFVLPANSPLASYSVRVRTAAVWGDILAQVWTFAPDGLPAIRIDNADLRYQPALTVNTTPDCLNQGGPILVNGQFEINTAGWSYVNYSSFSAVGGQLRVTHPASASYAAFWQELALALPSGRAFEFAIDLSNTTGAARDAQLVVRGPDWNTARICTFSLPSDGVSRRYTLRGTANGAWSGLFVQVWTFPGASGATLRADNAAFGTLGLGASVPGGLACAG
jgi:WD40 repeat protein